LKLHKRAIKHIFCGYLDGPKAVKYYGTKTHCIKISCNNKFSNPAVEFNKLDINVPSEGEKNRNASGTSGIQLMLPQTPSEHVPAKPAPKSEPSPAAKAGEHTQANQHCRHRELQLNTILNPISLTRFHSGDLPMRSRTTFTSNSEIPTRED
jgi:hypothetical protein